MKIVVIGSGAIGGLVAAYLKEKGEDVYLVGRKDAVDAINSSGIKVSGARREHKVSVTAHSQVVSKPDLAILAVKTQDIECALKDNAAFLKDSIVLTTQNGVAADEITAKYIPKDRIISSIVMFGSTYIEPGLIVHNFEGGWIIGRPFEKGTDQKLIDVSLVLDKAFPTTISDDIMGMKYMKVFVNANNCIPAILGLSMQEAFGDLDVSRISIGIWKEGFDIICKSGINLVSLPGFPLENITKMICIPPAQAAGIFSGIMLKLSKDPLYGSILQSIKRGKRSEVDFINGAFVALARKTGQKAPLNTKLVELVHAVEETGQFFTKDELLNFTKGLYD
ncbi:MAG: 2-dehydropantoate 2-reductase [Candidatus Omnitrophica bacterium]|nr:2-dehydropantoate 2-reductase [Candidatus Omnitrophota bacterium]